MAIKLTKEIEKKLIASIKRYAEENLDEEIGDLKRDDKIEAELLALKGEIVKIKDNSAGQGETSA